MTDSFEPPPPSLRAVPPSAERYIGKVVDTRYLLRREMGRGGISAVFLAEHRYTGRACALKLLLPEMRDHPEARTRLLAEARMLGAVRHPNVVEVIDAGLDAGSPFVVMERLRAKSLEALVTARGKLTVHDALTIGKLAAEALAATHAAYVIHRDFKPGNLLIVRLPNGGRTLKLIDFGVAAFLREEELNDDGPASAIVGTPVYMAPEHLAGARATPASDVYSFGASMFECLTGQVPFTGSFEQIYAKSISAARPDVRRLRPDVPLGIAQIIERCLAPRAEDRYTNGTQLLEALSLAGERIKEEETAQHETSRRGHVRVPYSAPVEVRLPTSEVVDGRIQDLSAGGIFITTAETLPQEADVMVRFALPTGAIITSEGFVRWVKEGRAQRAVGIEFRNIDPQVKHDIVDYVRSVT